MRWWLMTVGGLLTAAAATVGAVAVNVATGGTAPWFPSMEDHYLRWTAASVLLIAGAGLLYWWAERRYDDRLAALVPALQRPESWMVDRPGEVNDIVRALHTSPPGATIGITTAVHGAGGFGKTTVARLVRADRRVLRRFGGRVHWVTLGRDARRGSLAELVNGLVRQIDPRQAQPFADVNQAAEHLAAVLATGPRRLVVLDDVWFDDQVAAFPVRGQAARLVTTRNPSLVGADGFPVRVDQMSEEQASRVLTADLPSLDAGLTEGLLTETGRWPLLLRLINKVIVDQLRAGAGDADAVAADLLQQLHRHGALHVDRLTGAATRRMNVNDPQERGKAVSATIEASTGLLSGAERERFAELAIFIEDEAIPVALVADLWQATSGMTGAETNLLCVRLSDLALLTLTTGAEGGTVGLHDVVRDYLEDSLGTAKVAGLHAALMTSLTGRIPMAPAPVTDKRDKVRAWWLIPESARYLRDHLIEHLLAAGDADQARTLATDLRWVSMRTLLSGPLAPFTDLGHLDFPEAARLRRVLGQAAHLLAPTDPEHAVVDILLSRLGFDPLWQEQAAALAAGRSTPGLVNGWPLPDLPSPLLRRAFSFPDVTFTDLAISPDGTWIVAVDGGGSARILDIAGGIQRCLLADAGSAVLDVCVAGDGTWIATLSDDGAARIWDAETGRMRFRLPVSDLRLTRLAIAPDGTWLAVADADGRTSVWESVTGVERGQLTQPYEGRNGFAISPDSSWIATTSASGEVAIRDSTTGAERVALRNDLRLPGTGRRAAASAPGTSVIATPDGRQLVTITDDGDIRLWDVTTGDVYREIIAYTAGVIGLAISPDGSWLASTGHDQSVRIWDIASGRQRRLTEPGSSVTTVQISPDASWLATIGTDGVARIWDVATGLRRADLTGHAGRVAKLVIAPDGTWLGTVGDDGSVRIWDAATGGTQPRSAGGRIETLRIAFTPDATRFVTWPKQESDWTPGLGRRGIVRLHHAATGEAYAELPGLDLRHGALAIAPDSRWLATASDLGPVVVWDLSTGKGLAEMQGYVRRARHVAISPDNSEIAVRDFSGHTRRWNSQTREEIIAPAGRAAWADPGDQPISIAGVRTAVIRSPDGSWLAAASGRAVRIWDESTSRIVAIMRVDHDVMSCAWTPSGDALIVSGSAGLYKFVFRRPATKIPKPRRQPGTPSEANAGKRMSS
ncbi:NB-ARC domain-containing protein [Winogradskya humida]|uniref:NB-ARC domain-containing protein n=1 Tax=Winogradskya humida TaxID=113566 RepID=A0ABQ4A7D6_9ACTN|nr:NB-ARC domain-containing protein [Actinoplanes humidus]GIE26763.1 hypothetical protein Ahu01nite_098650 [Actinoplanes humidus]